MQLIRHLDRYDGPPCSVAIGNFDGLHRGHQAVLATMLSAASQQGLAPAVLTFAPHPRRFFAPDAPEFRLESWAMKLQRLRDAGVHSVFMPRFDAAFAGLSAVDFMQQVLGEQLKAGAVVTGENFVFGNARGGDHAQLAQWGKARGVAVHAVPPVQVGGQVCSSSAVRAALAQGDMAQAEALLGRPYRLAGRVLHGDKRGRELGMPTANIALTPGLKLPRHGIYAVWVWIGATRVAGAASLGVRPSIGHQEKATLEVHVLDYADDLYGQRLAVDFVQWMRAEAAFPDLAALQVAMQEDCVAVRQRLQE